MTTESASRRTVAAGVLMAINVAIRIAANLTLVRIALRHLGPRTFGIWVVLQSVATYLALSEMGLGQTTMNYQGDAIARGDHQRVNRVLVSAFLVYCFVIAVVLLVSSGIFAAAPVAQWLMKAPTPSEVEAFRRDAWLFASLTLLTIPLTVFPATLSGLRDLPVRQAIDLTLPLLVLFGSWLALRGGAGIRGLIVVPCAVQMLLGVAYYVTLRRRHPYIVPRLGSWSSSLGHELFSNSLFFFVIGLSLIVQRSSANLLTSRLGSLEQVPAVFAVVTILRVLGWSLLDIASRALQPYVILFAARGQADRVRFFALLATKLTAAGALLFVTGVVLFGEFAVGLWLGARVFVGYRPLLLLSLAYLAEVVFLPSYNFIVALNRHRVLSFVLVIHATASVVCGAVGLELASSDPISGMAAGFAVASLLVYAPMMTWAASRALGFSIRQLLGTTLRFAALTAVVLSIVSMMLVANAWAFVIRTVVAVSLAALIAMILHRLLLSNEERAWIAERLRGGLARLRARPADPPTREASGQ